MAIAQANELSLEKFLSDAMRTHPELAVFSEATQFALTDTLESGAPENPELGAGFFHSVSGADYSHSVSFTWPWRYGIRSARSRFCQYSKFIGCRHDV